MRNLGIWGHFKAIVYGYATEKSHSRSRRNVHTGLEQQDADLRIGKFYSRETEKFLGREMF